MTFLFVLYLLGCLGLLAAGVVERRRHDANLDRIGTRILVNGIRGKSSITRLCAGALRGGDLVTVAKTTGTAARFIHPDGSEEPVYRKFGLANVIEQVGIVRRAAAYRPDALVMECMAVMPDLQEVNQSALVRSTIGVLCNVREDHLAEMGPTLDDVARSLCRSMPVGGVCVTAERDRLPVLRAEAARRDCELIVVDPGSVTDEEMAGFSWLTFKENVAVALAVAELLGIRRADALAGMWAAAPDPGALTVDRYDVRGAELRVANVFAANDPQSTLMNIDGLLTTGALRRPLHVVINCRPDRVERNGQMGALVAGLDPDRVVLIGEPTRSARLRIAGRWQDRVVDLGGRRAPGELLDTIAGGVRGDTSLVLVGNIHGQGEVLLDELQKLPTADAGVLPAGALGREPWSGTAGRDPGTVLDDRAAVDDRPPPSRRAARPALDDLLPADAHPAPGGRVTPDGRVEPDPGPPATGHRRLGWRGTGRHRRSAVPLPRR